MEGACGELGHHREGHENTVTIKIVQNYITDTRQDFSMRPGGLSTRLLMPTPPRTQ